MGPALPAPRCWSEPVHTSTQQRTARWRSKGASPLPPSRSPVATSPCCYTLELYSLPDAAQLPRTASVAIREATLISARASFSSALAAFVRTARPSTASCADCSLFAALVHTWRPTVPAAGNTLHLLYSRTGVTVSALHGSVSSSLWQRRRCTHCAPASWFSVCMGVLFVTRRPRGGGGRGGPG